MLLIPWWFAQCDQPRSEASDQEIKEEIKAMYQQHLEDLKNLDHQSLMGHYANVDDHILFGDGEYWGNYETVSSIWGNFTKSTKEVLAWELSNQQINVLSIGTASYLMEYYNERITAEGDTAKVRGSVAYGLKKFDSGWKILTTHVTHYPVED